MRSRATAWLLMLAVSTAVPLSAEPQTSDVERRLKAALVSKFPQFVEWPDTVFAGRSTIDVCVAQPNPFGDDLKDLLAGETLASRAIVVRYVTTPQELDGCQILYLPLRPSGQRDPLLQRAVSMPILTVSDTPSFLDDGGVIRLRVVDGRMRFDVNRTAAERVGLRISSQLLQLAAMVRGGGS